MAKLIIELEVEDRFAHCLDDDTLKDEVMMRLDAMDPKEFPIESVRHRVETMDVPNGRFLVRNVCCFDMNGDLLSRDRFGARWVDSWQALAKEWEGEDNEDVRSVEFETHECDTDGQVMSIDCWKIDWVEGNPCLWHLVRA